ncbi:MAG: DUF4387 domain-containing protein [Alphaproteobacteria bacterium]|nr:DUF4387 domain-containing protein [Alphaproteobacteria bacterium]
MDIDAERGCRRNRPNQPVDRASLPCQSSCRASSASSPGNTSVPEPSPHRPSGFPSGAPSGSWANTATIGDVAAFVTSKNAGPYKVALDIVFSTAADYQRFVGHAGLDREAVAAIYGIPRADVLDVIHFAPAFAVKVTLKRRITAGARGDSDVYGAQQHVPLMQHRIPR